MRGTTKRTFLLAGMLLIIGAATIHGRPRELKILAGESSGQSSGTDQPSAGVRARADTVWYGGYDGSSNAVEGGIWDWDTAPLGDGFQGWTFVDMTRNPGIYFARVNAADFASHGDPCTPMILGTAGQIWCGIHEDEADQRDFVAGMGYQNYMKQRARSPAYAIVPSSEAIDIGFKYFNHSETDFDFTIICILCYDSSSQLIQEYEIDRLDGVHGSHTAPATYGSGSVEVPAGTLNPSTASVRLEFRVESDGSISDEDGDWDSPCGPFAADDITIQVGSSSNFYNFNVNAGGWTFDRYGVLGTFKGVLDGITRQAWLDSANVDTCGLSGNSLEFVDEVGSPFSPPGHPSGQWEMAVSCVVNGPLYGPPYEETIVRWKSYLCLPVDTGTVYRIGYQYYPHVSAANPIPHWSPRRGVDAWLYWPNLPRCRNETFNLSTLNGWGGSALPDDWEMLRVTYEVWCSCDAWWPGCASEGDTKGSPVIDDLQVGVINTLTGVSPEALGPSPAENRLVLEPSVPNPFSPQTAIHYRIPQAGHTSLVVYDAAGRLVRRLANRPQAAGRHVLVWDGRDGSGFAVSPGVYFVRLEAGSLSATQKVVRTQ